MLFYRILKYIVILIAQELRPNIKLGAKIFNALLLSLIWGSSCIIIILIMRLCTYYTGEIKRP